MRIKIIPRPLFTLGKKSIGIEFSKERHEHAINSKEKYAQENTNIKFFNESFGSNINRSLFDNIDELSALVIKDQITESIENFEPRVDTVKVVTSPDFDNNSFDVVLTYEIIGADVSV